MCVRDCNLYTCIMFLVILVWFLCRFCENMVFFFVVSRTWILNCVVFVRYNWPVVSVYSWSDMSVCVFVSLSFTLFCWVFFAFLPIGFLCIMSRLDGVWGNENNGCIYKRESSTIRLHICSDCSASARVFVCPSMHAWSRVFVAFYWNTDYPVLTVNSVIRIIHFMV